MASSPNYTRMLFGLIFVLYLLLLTKNILFKKGPAYYKNYFQHEYKHYSWREGWKHANKVPFSTINLFYNSRHMDSEYRQNNLLGNLLGFMPFGILLPLLLPWFRHFFKILFAGFLLSLGYECTQLFFGLGIFDVDDLILNTAGASLGGITFLVGRRIWKRENANVRM